MMNNVHFYWFVPKSFLTPLAPLYWCFLTTVAAEYRCKYEILDGLLSSYGGAANVQRQLLKQPEAATATKKDGGDVGGGGGQVGRQQTKKDHIPQYALEIFEEGRGKEGTTALEEAE